MQRIHGISLSFLVLLLLVVGSVAFAQSGDARLETTPVSYNFAGSFSIVGGSIDIRESLAGACTLTNNTDIRCDTDHGSFPLQVQNGQGIGDVLTKLGALLSQMLAVPVDQNSVINGGFSTLLSVAGLSASELPGLTAPGLAASGGAHYAFSSSLTDFLASGYAPVLMAALMGDTGGDSQLAAMVAMAAAVISEGNITFDLVLDPANGAVLSAAVILNITSLEITATSPEYAISLNFALNRIAPATVLEEPEPVPVIDMTVPVVDNVALPAPTWEALDVQPTGECPDYLIYHTDMTGDWEIFRLGDLPDSPEADPNLSRGVGRRIFDLMPTRSPDNEWIAFTSNRDANWEIYVSSVKEPIIRRVTFNTTAVDQNPVWSPLGNAIVFESNRDNDWNLYLFDVITGQQRQLTFSRGNEIGAFWAHSGTKIAYQSDRDGFWQIYELDLMTSRERLISDAEGDDHAPHYSLDDEQIAFRSYRDGDNSVVYVMNVDGTGLTQVSNPTGNALNHSWSPDNGLIGYQSDVDGDNDIYVYDVETGETRLVTDNTNEDYAPTWICESTDVAFTSDITEDANIFEVSTLPIDAPGIDVETEAAQLTFVLETDQYPMDTPPEENASRQEALPSPVKNR